MLRLCEYAVHQRRPIHAFLKTGFMDEIEGPAHRLAIGNHQVELIEPVEMLLIEHPGHDPMHRKR